MSHLFIEALTITNLGPLQSTIMVWVGIMLACVVGIMGTYISAYLDDLFQPKEQENAIDWSVWDLAMAKSLPAANWTFEEAITWWEYEATLPRITLPDDAFSGWDALIQQLEDTAVEGLTDGDFEFLGFEKDLMPVPVPVVVNFGSSDWEVTASPLMAKVVNKAPISTLQARLQLGREIAAVMDKLKVLKGSVVETRTNRIHKTTKEVVELIGYLGDGRALEPNLMWSTK